MVMQDLTFVTFHIDGTKDLWTPERTGDYAADIALGNDYAAELILFIRATSNASFFGAVLRTITRKGVYGPTEIGFCNAIGVTLVGLNWIEPASSAVKPLSAAA